VLANSVATTLLWHGQKSCTETCLVPMRGGVLHPGFPGQNMVQPRAFGNSVPTTHVPGVAPPGETFGQQTVRVKQAEVRHQPAVAGRRFDGAVAQRPDPTSPCRPPLHQSTLSCRCRPTSTADHPSIKAPSPVAADQHPLQTNIHCRPTSAAYGLQRRSPSSMFTS
jgi:hypothetical protein